MKRKIEGKLPSPKRHKMDNSKEEIWKDIKSYLTDFEAQIC